MFSIDTNQVNLIVGKMEYSQIIETRSIMGEIEWAQIKRVDFNYVRF